MPVESSGRTTSTPESEISKLQQRLQLLRQEYVKLQTRLAEVERDHSTLAAMANGSHKSGNSFASEILKKIGDLFNRHDYSDLKIKLSSDEEIFAHKFILSARNKGWGLLESGSVLDWSHLDCDVSLELLRWVYTNHVSLELKDDMFKLELMKTAKGFFLTDLVTSCERALIAAVEVKNCIRFYTTADEINAEELMNHCSKLILAHWEDFTSEDFAHMSAPLLFSMFKSKTKYPLHSSVRLKREDVVFLYLIEFNNQLSVLVNQPDDKGLLPLDLALITKQEELANTLIEHKADVNRTDNQGHTLLHKAVARNDVFSSLFLCKNGAHVNVSTPETGDTPLHMAAKYESLRVVAEKLLELGADTNAQNDNNWTPLHSSIINGNESVFELMLTSNANLEIRTNEGYPALFYALKQKNKPFAKLLVQKGAPINTVCGPDNNTLVHLCALDEDENGAIFLIESGASIDKTNRRCESPLHIACAKNLKNLTRTLIDKGANCNLQTISDSDGSDYRQTPLHLAVIHGSRDAITELLSSREKTKINLNLKNSAGHTPLALALLLDATDVASELLHHGASVDILDHNGLTLLHSAIMDGNTKMALFLMNNGADVNHRTDKGQTCLELSIETNLLEVVERLCQLGADMSAAISLCNPPLWIALEKNLEIASILVRNGVDVDGWSEVDDGYCQTLLHRAIDENKIDTAKFLIRSGCDLNSPRKQGSEGKGGEEAHDLASPLHLCCQWGLEEVVQTLLEHGAFINAKDVEGKTPIHHAIESGHQQIIGLLLDQSGLDLSIRDKSGQSPFATAMTFKNNGAAKRILQLEPLAAEQYDTRGRNFLHTAILRDDLESVLFLLSINVNVHSRTQDSNSQFTPLLLAVQKGNEMIVRNLLLAGASVNDFVGTDHGALHLAAENNLSEICSILLANGADFSAVDSRGNNSLHLAVKEGHLATIRVLLTESQIDAEASNGKGRNSLHILANFGQDNSVSIFELFIECMPNYPLNKTDAEGNTPLLLAYIKGNGPLCRSLVKAGAVLGTLNHQGVSIFNCQVATKQLLYRLLDFLSQEPKWGEGDVCEECNAKFGITTRKHHCRHCGRLLCSKCSDKDMPILKYNLSKPVRVCDLCADVLTVGPSAAGS